PRRTQLISVRATRLRPRSVRARAGTLPPPSPVSSTSCASSASSPARSPWLGGRKEPSCQLVALLARGLDARPAPRDVVSRSRRQLTDVVLVLANDLRDLRMVVVEHVVQQQHRALLRREALPQSARSPQDHSRARQSLGR